MKQQLIKILSAFMFVVFLYGIAPHEYVHDLIAHHEDTIDHIYKKGEFHISARHTHCYFMGITFGHFLSAEKIIYLFEAISYILKSGTRIHNSYLSVPFHFGYLRGPPSHIFFLVD